MLSSIDGKIFQGNPATISLSGSGFLSGSCVVTFTVGSSTYTVNRTASSDTSITGVSVPSQVYNSSAGTTVNISVTNPDGHTSGALSLEVNALPSGGTVTTAGGYRVHTYTSSGVFVHNGTLDVQYLLVGGGGGGGLAEHNGAGDGGGGAGAGGMLVSSGTVTGSSSSVTVGAGGSGMANGGSTTFAGETAVGGGRGGSDAGTNNTAGDNGGASGGSGGGAASTCSSTAYGGSGTSGQGNDGGYCSGCSTTWCRRWRCRSSR